MAQEHKIVGQVNGQTSPRYAGLTTFARLPRQEDVNDWDVALVGVPFDAGVTFRPGARFGPSAIREASRLLRPYNPAQQISAFDQVQVVDAGDIDANPFSIETALADIERGLRPLAAEGRRFVTLGGDHTIALPALRALAEQHGPMALVHFDAHLDTSGHLLRRRLHARVPIPARFRRGADRERLLGPRWDSRVALFTRRSRRRRKARLHDHSLPRL